jgi:hypothetical protein
MKNPKNHIIPTTILLFSLWTLINTISQLSDIYSFISIIVGLTGVVLYYRDNKNFDKLFYFWVYMQVPNITYSDLHVMSSFPLSLGLGFGLGLKNNNNLDLYFNALPIGIYYLIKYYNVDKPLNCQIAISRLRKGTFPQIQFPISGVIEKLSGRNKITGVYLINLDQEIAIKDKTYKYILLEPKNSSLIDINDKWQICGLRICENPDLIYHDKFNPFIDWVTIQTK